MQLTRRLLVAPDAGLVVGLVALDTHLGRVLAAWVQTEFEEAHQVVLLTALRRLRYQPSQY